VGGGTKGRGSLVGDKLKPTPGTGGKNRGGGGRGGGGGGGGIVKVWPPSVHCVKKVEVFTLQRKQTMT